MFASLIGFARGLIPTPYTMAAYAVAAAVIFGAGFRIAWVWQENAQKAALVDAIAAKDAAVEKAAEITAEASKKAAERKVEIQTVTKTIIKKVPVYVTREADSRCAVPRGFVRLHDSAAAGMPPVPDTSGEPDDGPSGVALSAVAGTVVDNYGSCQETRQQLIDLQDWLRLQRAATQARD